MIETIEQQHQLNAVFTTWLNKLEAEAERYLAYWNHLMSLKQFGRDEGIPPQAPRALRAGKLRIAALEIQTIKALKALNDATGQDQLLSNMLRETLSSIKTTQISQVATVMPLAAL